MSKEEKYQSSSQHIVPCNPAVLAYIRKCQSADALRQAKGALERSASTALKRSAPCEKPSTAQSLHAERHLESKADVSELPLSSQPLEDEGPASMDLDQWESLHSVKFKPDLAYMLFRRQRQSKRVRRSRCLSQRVHRRRQKRCWRPYNLRHQELHPQPWQLHHVPLARAHRPQLRTVQDQENDLPVQKHQRQLRCLGQH